MLWHKSWLLKVHMRLPTLLSLLTLALGMRCKVMAFRKFALCSLNTSIFLMPFYRIKIQMTVTVALLSYFTIFYLTVKSWVCNLSLHLMKFRLLRKYYTFLSYGLRDSMLTWYVGHVKYSLWRHLNEEPFDSTFKFELYSETPKPGPRKISD